MKQSLQSCMQQHGQGLIQAMALALVQSCPRNLLRALSVPLLALVTDPVVGETAKSVLQQVCCSQQYAGRGMPLSFCSYLIAKCALQFRLLQICLACTQGLFDTVRSEIAFAVLVQDIALLWSTALSVPALLEISGPVSLDSEGQCDLVILRLAMQVWALDSWTMSPVVCLLVWPCSLHLYLLLAFQPC